MEANNPLLMTAFALVFCALIMTGAWLLALRLQFLSLVDAVWAIGIGLCGAGYALSLHAHSLHALVAAFIALFWSLRLGFHLVARLKSHYPHEDSRYKELKRRWGAGFWFKSFLFFQFQAVLQAFFSFPFAAIASNQAPFPQNSEIVGLLMFFLSVAAETIADAQLKQFKAEPRNRNAVCNVGLWRYSRHPNYFFEWTTWCAVALIAFGAPMGPLAMMCPIVMLFLLLFVTGVAPSEAQSLKSRGQAYRVYQRTTNKFIPWCPKGGQNAV